MFSVNRGVKLLNSSVSSSNASIAASVTCSDASCLKVSVVGDLSGNDMC